MKNPLEVGVLNYNGPGFDSVHGTTNGYLTYVLKVMAGPSDYVEGEISKK